ncbi:MAG: ribonuclease HI family protein [Phycisphaeraceae bacterium]
MNCIIHIDGGSRGNPGPAGVGVVIHDAETREPIHEAGYFVGRTTNNVAEYTGLIRALELAHTLGANAVQIRSDSQLLVRQLLGQYRVKSADLKPLFDQARQHLAGFEKWKLDHVRRELNQRADELANLAMDARRDVLVTPNGAPADASADEPPLAWRVTVQGDTPRCPAHMPADQAVDLGPTVGYELCIYAAAAVFATGLPDWASTKKTAKTRCARCDRTITIRRT